MIARVAACSLTALLLAACSGREDEGATLATLPIGDVERVFALFNRGVGLMERYRPAEAEAAFAEVVRLAPGWVTGRLNLGIALLNAPGEEARARAEVELRRVVQQDPDNRVAHYSLGLLLRHLSRAGEAEAEFRHVLELDPDDADAHYQLGVLVLDEDPAAARAHLEKTLALVPHHESACYRLQSLLRQEGEPERAAALLRRFSALRSSKAGVAFGMKYGEMGRYAAVIRAFEHLEERADASDRPPEYEDVARAAGLSESLPGAAGWPGGAERAGAHGAAAFGPGLAVADVDGDRGLDVVTVGSEVVLLRGKGGAFERATDTGIDCDAAVGAFFGDYDADGDPDLYVTRAGPNRLYQNRGDGRFVDVTAESGTAGAATLSVGASWLDADHDGDLDLFVANYCRWPLDGDVIGAANALWRNNGDGTFDEVAATAGIDGGEVATTGCLPVDVDGDLDLDLYVVNDGAANQLFLNDRVGSYRRAGGELAILEDDGPGVAAMTGDLDRNGLEDLLLLRGREAPRLFLQLGRGTFVVDERFAGAVRPLGGAAGGLLGDLDLDGDLDLVLLDARSGARCRHVVLMGRGAGEFAPLASFGPEREEPTARGAMAVDLDRDGSLELIVTRAGQAPEVWRAEPPAGRHWLEVVPIADVEAERSWLEPAARGLQVEVKTGPWLQVGRLGASAGYLASPPLLAHFGLGSVATSDYVRLQWPDAVLQSELEVAGDRAWEIEKVVRRPSSCPVLFSWDGERFAFVTDFLGVGGVGFFVAPGEYAPPDPTESVRIPPDAVQPRDGRYLLRVVEPLEEVAYVDQLELAVFDHPAEVELHPDERFTGTPPLPTGRPWALVEKVFPEAASDRDGASVLPALLSVDRRYVEPPVLRRFVGYAEDHWLDLDFGARLRDLPEGERVVLYLYGWVEYTYSHVNYAAWQAGLTMRPPSIEVPDGRGGWRVAVADAGFPAGLPRMMTVDVTDLPIREHGRFRIRTNMEVFWDQVFVGQNVEVPELREHRLRPAVARLRHLGYPREYSPDGRDPTLYDYDRLDHGVAFKNLAGDYTRFGDVRELLAEVDDRFVIMGRGEEIVLEFDARALPRLPEGHARTLVLRCDGYCKDMDLYTAHPDTVAPLPFHGMTNYPPDTQPPPDQGEDAHRWHTRTVREF